VVESQESTQKLYTWNKFKQVLEYTKISKPKPMEKRRMYQCALRYTNAEASTIEEPDVGKLHVRDRLKDVG